MDAPFDTSDGDIPGIHKRSKPSALPNFAAKHGKDREEIDRLVDTLQRATQVREAHHATPAQDTAIPTILETILDRLWDVDPAEKVVWLSKDILKVLVKTVCLNARRSQSYTTAIDICRHLISDSREASTTFSRLVLTHMTTDKECMGVSDCLYQLINVVPLRSVLIEELGVPKLLDVYTNITVEYNASLESIIKDTQTLINDASDYKGLEKNKPGQTGNFNLDTMNFNPPARYFSAPSVLEKEPKDGATNHHNSITDSPSSGRRPFHPPSHITLPQNDIPSVPTANGQSANSNSISNSTTPTSPASTTSTPSTSSGEPVRPRALSLIKQQAMGAQRVQSPTSSSSPTLTPTSSASRPSIPILKIPLRSDSVQTLHTRSSRREHGGGANSGRSSVDMEFVQAPSKQLSDLATKLGETYMATDLTALVSFKQAIDAHHTRINGVKYGTRLVMSDGREAIVQSPIRPEVATLRASNAYKVKSSILKVLVALTSQPSLLKYIRSPINILYTELIEIYQNLVLSDGEFKNLLYQLLFNWADYVEYLHRNRWREITKGMSTERKIHFRKKLDKFLWRVHNNICAHMEAAAYTEVNVLLAMLGDYMSNCPTRVMSSQVVDVCMESLLKMKHLVFTRGKFTTLRLNDFRMMHNMLVVFDEVASQNMHLPLNDLLLALFVERDDTLSHVKDYMSVVLFGTTLEKEIGKDATSKVTITDYRVRAIKHFEVCVDMIRQQAESSSQSQPGNVTPLSDDSPPKNSRGGGLGSSRDRDYSPTASGDHPPSNIEILLKKLEFLLNPGSGYILQFLYQDLGSHYDNFAVKKHMLQLLCKIFELKGNPFVRKKSYVDAYVSYFYIRFIKLYQNYVLDPPIIEFCQLYLRLLLAFSMCKTERIAMKFYQLKTMDFLVREISLEYEVKLNREAKDSVPFQLSAKLQKAKGKEDTNSFPHPPGTRQLAASEPAASSSTGDLNKSDSNSEKKAEKKDDDKVSDPNNSSPPRAVQRQSVKLNLSFMDKTNAATNQSDTDLRKSTHLPRIPSKESSSDKPVSILRSKGDTTPPSSASSAEDGSVYSSKPPVAAKNALNASDPAPSMKPTIPKLQGLSSTSGNSPVPSLKLGGLGSSAHASPPAQPQPQSPSTSSQVSGTPSVPKLAVSSLKLSNTIPISPKGKVPEPVANGVKKVPALKLPPVRLKTAKDEPQEPSLSSRPLSGLSAMEQKIDVNDPKFQLLLDNPTQQTFSSVDKSSQFGRPTTPADLLAENLRYSQERNNRKIYHAKDLHIAFLQLIFSMMLTGNYTLDPLYSDQFPMVAKKLNIPFILHLHINHVQNEAMVSELVSVTQAMGTPYFRLLKLLFVKIFNPLLYDDLERVATGAYGTVYKTKLIHKENVEIAVKLMAVPKSIHDRCVLHDIFTEILILDKFKTDPRCCHLYDYGVDNDSYWIVMTSYKCSLKEWRLRQTQTSFAQALPLYLNIFMAILNTVVFLVENKVNHFDIKCDNFLLHPKHPSIPETDFWQQPSSIPNFNVSLADFGEAKIFREEVDGYTTRNRGTEFIKSPEMLTVAYASQKTRDQYDRRKQVGSNSASDVWSIGCLLYELITGEFLFYDDDWVRFFIRVTSPGQELLTEEKKAKMGDLTPLIEFLEFIFIRDPFYRPTIRDVITKFTVTKPVILQQLAATNHTVDRTRERSASVYTNVPRTPTHNLSMSRRDTIGEKYTTREPTSSRYSPGRYTPHLAQPPSFRQHTPATTRPQTPQVQSSSQPSQPLSPHTAPPPAQSQSQSHTQSQPQSNSNSNSNTQPHTSHSVPQTPHPVPQSPQLIPHSKSQPQSPVSRSSPNSPFQAPQPKIQPSQQQPTGNRYVVPVPKATPRDSPFDLPPDPPIELEFPEHEYFMRAPSQITPFLYLSSYNPSLDRPMLKHKLHITHIINCTGSPNAFPDHFEYLHLKLHDEASQDILTPLQRVFDFIRDGHLHKGRVLIFSDKGISRSVALCVAYLMDSYAMSYFEAYLYVRDRRYISAPNPGFVEQLCKWNNDKKKSSNAQPQQALALAPPSTYSSSSSSGSSSLASSVASTAPTVPAAPRGEKPSSPTTLTSIPAQSKASTPALAMSAPAPPTPTILTLAPARTLQAPTHSKRTSGSISDDDSDTLTSDDSSLLPMMTTNGNGNGSVNGNERNSDHDHGHKRNGVEMPLDALFDTMELRPMTWWQCFCGACSYALFGDFDSSKFRNPQSCSCLMDEPSDCPYIGCSVFLDEMKKLHDFNAENIIWGYAPQKDINMGNLERNSAEVQPLKGIPSLIRPNVTRKDWRLFRCRTCHFLTHAISTQHPPASSTSSSSHSPSAMVAFVTNIPRQALE